MKLSSGRGIFSEVLCAFITHQYIDYVHHSYKVRQTIKEPNTTAVIIVSPRQRFHLVETEKEQINQAKLHYLHLKMAVT